MLNMVVIVVVVWGMCLLVFKYGRHDPLGLVFFFSKKYISVCVSAFFDSSVLSSGFLCFYFGCLC